MAHSLPIIGSTLLRAFKPILGNPSFLIPSSVNLQVRHAKRKGYREKAMAKKRKEKLAKAATQKPVQVTDRQKVIKIEKTIELKKVDIPQDDVYIKDNFKEAKYSIIDAVNFHKEYHHPTVYDNQSAPIIVKIEFDMTKQKKTQVIKPFQGIFAVTHKFDLKKKKDVLVFCKSEDEKLALDCGATVAGGAELIKKVQDGYIQPAAFDYVICHSNFINDLIPIRNYLKLKMPKLKQGTLTVDLAAAIDRFLNGIEYKCIKSPSMDDFGVVECEIGRIYMDPVHIEDNFKALLKDIDQFKPPKDRDFITWIWCRSPPSNERFAIDVSQYVTSSVKTEEEEEEKEDENEVQGQEEVQEKEVKN